MATLVEAQARKDRLTVEVHRIETRLCVIYVLIEKLLRRASSSFEIKPLR